MNENINENGRVEQFKGITYDLSRTFTVGSDLENLFYVAYSLTDTSII